MYLFVPYADQSASLYLVYLCEGVACAWLSWDLLDNGEFKVETFRVQHDSVSPKLDRFKRRGSTCFS